MPLKKSAAAMRRLLVMTVALIPSTAAGSSAAGSLLASDPPIVPRHCPDDDRVAVALDALELDDAAEVDEVGRFRQALLQGRDERDPAGEKLRLVLARNRLRRVGHALRPLIIEVVHGLSLPISC